MTDSHQPDVQPDVQIVVQVPPDEKDEIAAELRREGADVLVVTGQGFDGAQTVDLLIKLTPSVAAFVAGLYVARLKANRHIAVKFKGIEIKGVSEPTLLKILDRADAHGRR